MTRRIVHLISEYSAREAMGRTVAETARRVPGEHHLVTTRIHDGAEDFASVTELGGSLFRFPAEDPARLSALLDCLGADVVHLHAGVLGSFLGNRAGLGRRPLVQTMYAWPNLPSRVAWQHAGWAGLRSSNVLPNRVLITSAVPALAIRRSLDRLAPAAVLSPDPRVLERLEGRITPPVMRLYSGAPHDERRASFDPADGRPTVVFAGRAESVRGIGTLLEAFPSVVAAVPGARLRLLTLPRPELQSLAAKAQSLGLADAVEFRTDPVDDLLGAFAEAQVGAWPFLADYTTSPPAMALAEAMAVGLPVVSTPVACVRAVMRPNLDGLAVPPGDATSLAHALVRLLTDRAAWQQYAAAGLTAANQLSWEHAAETATAAYARVDRATEAGSRG